MRSYILRACLLAAAATAAPCAIAHEELVVAQDAAGRLVLHAHFESPLGVPESVFPAFPGWATGEFGLVSLDVADEAEGLFPPPPDSDLVFILTHVDDDLSVWNDHGTAPMIVGESFHMGTPFFDTHPILQINPGTPGQLYEFRIFVRDLAGRAADSAEFAMTLTPLVPGDANCDGLVDNADIDFFVAALLNDEAAYELLGGQHSCWHLRDRWGDLNDDLAVDNGDIDAFVALLLG